ncbi:hypothetical protein GQR58_020979 [Nymphon striatum]|nr:hypothetical protein GQR58_020979 [Nymphon striatum]
MQQKGVQTPPEPTPLILPGWWRLCYPGCSEAVADTGICPFFCDPEGKAEGRTYNLPYSKSVLINAPISQTKVKPSRLSCNDFIITTNLYVGFYGYFSVRGHNQSVFEKVLDLIGQIEREYWGLQDYEGMEKTVASEAVLRYNIELEDDAAVPPLPENGGYHRDCYQRYTRKSTTPTRINPQELNFSKLANTWMTPCHLI